MPNSLSPKSSKSSSSLCGNWLREDQKLLDSDTDDDDSMFVNTPSLFEMAIKRFPEISRVHTTRSHPETTLYIPHISRKNDFLKRFWSKKQRRVERHISMPTKAFENGNVKVIGADRAQRFSRILSFSKSQFDVNSVERRIEIGESGKTHSIGKNF